jgi:hypothetical protein
MAGYSKGLEILKEAAKSLPSDSDWHGRLRAAMCDDAEIGVHLGVFVEPYLEAILDGRKTIESRFGVHRCAPFDRVQRGDIIFLKRSGGPVVGMALAAGADYYHLDADVLDDLRGRFATELYAEDEAFWSARADKRFATLIHIDDTLKIETMDIDKRDRRGWVTYFEGKPSCALVAH